MGVGDERGKGERTGEKQRVGREALINLITAPPPCSCCSCRCVMKPRGDEYVSPVIAILI